MVACNTKPFPERFEIDTALKSKAIQVHTGDIFFRETDTRGPFNIPFSALVSSITESQYSHASIALVEDGEIYLVEVNDRGCIKYRLLDWLDYCVGKRVEVWRYVNHSPEFEINITRAINDFFKTDPEYDFTYGDPAKFYCTESVVTMYQRVGLTLMAPREAKEVFKQKWAYYTFLLANWATVKTSGMGFNIAKDKYYFIGNETNGGLMASPLLTRIYKYPTA